LSDCCEECACPGGCELRRFVRGASGLVGEAVEDVAYEDGVDVRGEVAAECAGSASSLEDAANLPVEFGVILAQRLPGAGRKPVFDAGGVVGMSPDRHHVPDELPEFVLGLVDDA
jgi:hypothetical protein